jgi:amino acid permease
MSPLVFLTPVWFVFEIIQLIVSERFLGVKRIKTDADPRQLGPREPLAFLWCMGIMLFWLWLVAMLFQSTGRAAAVAMLVITLVGFSIRRICGLRWVLVVLTFEGALRIGMLLYLSALIWRRI